jgi:ribosomal protein L16 Arg81 hydroxylase
VAIDLTRILRPLTPETFVARHWTRRPVHIRGTPARFRALRFGQPSLRALCAGPAPPEVIAQHHDIDGVPRRVSVDPRLAEPLYRAGMTLCFERLEQLHPPLARCAAAFKLGLHYPDTVAVNAYWSPHGAGFGLHFDCHQTFILQIEGEKRWRHSAAPLVEFPPTNLAFGDPAAVAAFRRDYPWARLQPPAERTLVERILRPGDVLYLPAGTAHRTDARGHSLSLTVACWRTSVLELLWQHLARAVRPAAAWRQPLPAFTRRRPGPRPLPPATAAFLAARLADLRAMVNGWTPDDLAATLFSSVSDLPLVEPLPAQPAPVRRSDRFEVPTPITCVETGGDTVLVFAGGARLSVPATGRTFLQRLAGRRRFRARDASTWTDGSRPLPWSEVRAALDTLLGRGVIRRRPGA